MFISFTIVNIQDFSKSKMSSAARLLHGGKGEIVEGVEHKVHQLDVRISCMLKLCPTQSDYDFSNFFITTPIILMF